jgi:hypothetical protein
MRKARESEETGALGRAGNPKFQAPSSKEAPNFKLQWGSRLTAIFVCSFRDLEMVWDLGFGIWDFAA